MGANIEVSLDMEDPWREKSSSILKFDSVPPDFPAGRL
jgi:hypothetical protein